MYTTLETVESLNDSLYDKSERFFSHGFSYTTNSTSEAVTLDVALDNSHCQILLWCSENSQRAYIEEINEYEPLKDTLIRELSKIIKELTEIKEEI